MAIKTPRKLIEVALPLDEINKACGTEKSIRHGHPSTLHLWLARRPLAAARAVLFAQLVNDPSEWRKPDGKKLGKKEAEAERRSSSGSSPNSFSGRTPGTKRFLAAPSRPMPAGEA